MIGFDHLTSYGSESKEYLEVSHLKVKRKSNKKKANPINMEEFEDF
jgi:hypothetical protein